MAKTFNTGEIVKFASCGPTYQRTCERCTSCIADAFTLIDKKGKKTGSCYYVHGIITDIFKTPKRKGKRCIVQVRKNAPRRPADSTLDAGNKVEVPMWLLRPSTHALEFKPTAKEEERYKKTEVFNILSIL